MIDIAKQIAYWRDGSQEDWEVGEHLLAESRARHGLFLLHLAMEKLLKAHVCRTTRNVPPRIHNLSRLVELSGVSLDASQTDLLAEMNQYNLEGRYPDTLQPLPPPDEVRQDVTRYREVYECLMRQL